MYKEGHCSVPEGKHPSVSGTVMYLTVSMFHPAAAAVWSRHLQLHCGFCFQDVAADDKQPVDVFVPVEAERIKIRVLACKKIEYFFAL